MAFDASKPETWRMHGENVPAFKEYLNLVGEAGWGELMYTDAVDVREGDALVVVDMQGDFIPIDKLNSQGGAFAVNEGATVVTQIVSLMEHFIARNGLVAVTRDYHPANHCSFIESGGPFPKHCVQGTVGSHFYPTIGECVKKLRDDEKTVERIEVVFKGFHPDIDSFGSFQYPDDPSSLERVTNRQNEERCYGCSLTSWTGCYLLECSNIANDVNAPPDVMAGHARVNIADWLRRKDAKRIFACGLAMDFCVMDTVCNSLKAGFKDTFLILDAARAAHLPGIGQIGSGFLQDPVQLKTKMVSCGARLISTVALLPSLVPVNPISKVDIIRQGFPSALGPFALVAAKKLELSVDTNSLTWKASKPENEIRILRDKGLFAAGMISPVTPVTLDADAKARAGIPARAVSFAWGFPVGQGDFADQARAYLSITSPSAAFFVYGGYIYFDGRGKVVRVMAITLGDGLFFGKPEPWRAEFASALEKRWQPVTAPFLEEKGAKKFTWIGPGEVLQAPGQEPWTVSTHGAFVYLFHDDVTKADDRDIFFAVESGQQDIHSAQLGEVARPAVDDPQLYRSLSDHGKAMLTAFSQWDVQKTGSITPWELGDIMTKLDPTISHATITAIVEEMDLNKNGHIEYEEFVQWLDKAPLADTKM